ncbi:hypothetical protein N665_0018s0007 [Sinapis alba]|nr:hypothetical protein N665_0018s0007 [Sinapis alba]
MGEGAQTDQEEIEKEGEKEKDKEQDDETERNGAVGINVQEEGAQFEVEEPEAEKDAEEIEVEEPEAEKREEEIEAEKNETPAPPPAPALPVETSGTERTPAPPTPVVVTNKPRSRPKTMEVRKHTPRKRGRPRKAEKPQKFTTPPPEKGHVHHHSGFPLLSPRGIRKRLKG